MTLVKTSQSFWDVKGQWGDLRRNTIQVYKIDEAFSLVHRILHACWSIFFSASYFARLTALNLSYLRERERKKKSNHNTFYYYCLRLWRMHCTNNINNSLFTVNFVTHNVKHADVISFENNVSSRIEWPCVINSRYLWCEGLCFYTGLCSFFVFLESLWFEDLWAE